MLCPPCTCDACAAQLLQPAFTLACVQVPGQMPARLLCVTQVATAAAGLMRPCTGDAIAAVARGGLSCFRLAHVESEAQAAMPLDTPAAVRPNPCLPHDMRCSAANIMAGVCTGLMLPVAHALAKQGLVAPLLQVDLPMPCSTDLHSLQ